MAKDVPIKFKQLFKLVPPSDIFYNFLDLNFEYELNAYKITGVFFNKCIYKNTLNEFCEKITPFYHNSKQAVTNINNNYSKFTTMIRHLTKIYELEYKKIIKYTKSYYDIEYYIMTTKYIAVN